MKKLKELWNNKEVREPIVVLFCIISFISLCMGIVAGCKVVSKSEVNCPSFNIVTRFNPVMRGTCETIDFFFKRRWQEGEWRNM